MQTLRGNFREIRYFDIEGKLTGLVSRAMTAPCGKIRIPINESSDDKSQIEEFIREYKGEGIQHIALTTENDETVRIFACPWHGLYADAGQSITTKSTLGWLAMTKTSICCVNCGS